MALYTEQWETDYTVQTMAGLDTRHIPWNCRCRPGRKRGGVEGGVGLWWWWRALAGSEGGVCGVMPRVPGGQECQL